MKRLTCLSATILCLLAVNCAKQPAADDMVKKYVQTQGGEAALAAITDQVSKWDAKFTYPLGDSMIEMTAEMIITYKRPDKIKFEMFNPDGSTANATVLNGAQGWQYLMGQNVREMTQAEIAENTAVAEGWIDGFHNYAAKGIALELLPDTTLEGNSYAVLRAIDRFGNRSMNYCDAQTGLVARTEGEYTDPMDMSRKPSTMTFANYASFQGFMSAGIFKQYDGNGALMFEATLKELQNNAGVEDEAFAPPVAPETMPMEESAPEEHEEM